VVDRELDHAGEGLLECGLLDLGLLVDREPPCSEKRQGWSQDQGEPLHLRSSAEGDPHACARQEREDYRVGGDSQEAEDGSDRVSALVLSIEGEQHAQPEAGRHQAWDALRGRRYLPGRAEEQEEHGGGKNEA